MREVVNSFSLCTDIVSAISHVQTDGLEFSAFVFDLHLDKLLCPIRAVSVANDLHALDERRIANLIRHALQAEDVLRFELSGFAAFHQERIDHFC